LPEASLILLRSQVSLAPSPVRLQAVFENVDANSPEYRYAQQVFARSEGPGGEDFCDDGKKYVEYHYGQRNETGIKITDRHVNSVFDGETQLYGNKVEFLKPK
jgi:hypothetical protein